METYEPKCILSWYHITQRKELIHLTLNYNNLTVYPQGTYFNDKTTTKNIPKPSNGTQILTVSSNIVILKLLY